MNCLIFLAVPAAASEISQFFQLSYDEGDFGAPLCGATCSAKCTSQGLVNGSAAFDVCCELCTWSVSCDCVSIDAYVDTLGTSRLSKCSDALEDLISEGCVCELNCVHPMGNCE